VELERAGARPLVSEVELEVLAVAAFRDGAAAPVEAGRPCDAAGGELHEARATVGVRPGEPGITPIARFETEGRGRLTELRVFLRGALERAGRRHSLDGAETCVAADGEDVAVLRVVPPAPPDLAGGRDLRVVARFDAAEQVRQQRLLCDPSAPSGATIVDPPGTPFFDPDGPDECREPDDEQDDADPATRLRFVLDAAMQASVFEGVF
jgi:hypothetical protein